MGNTFSGFRTHSPQPSSHAGKVNFHHKYLGSTQMYVPFRVIGEQNLVKTN